MLRVVCLVGGVSLGACDWVQKNVFQYGGYAEYSAFYITEGDALELEHP